MNTKSYLDKNALSIEERDTTHGRMLLHQTITSLPQTEVHQKESRARPKTAPITMPAMASVASAGEEGTEPAEAVGLCVNIDEDEVVGVTHKAYSLNITVERSYPLPSCQEKLAS